MSSVRFARLMLVAAALIASPGPSPADTLRAGLIGAATTLDPHLLDTPPNAAFSAHLFDRLVHLDTLMRPQPGLAVRWRLRDERTWEIDLREGVRFHDGSAFTADDVVATIARVRRMGNSPAPFTPYIQPIEEIAAIAPHRLLIRTRTPFPLLLSQLALVNVVSHRYADADTALFNAGTAAIGTGPYRLVRWSPDGSAELARNDSWWGGETAWQRVTVRPIPRDATRVASLLAGDVDVIDQVSPADAEQLAARPDLSIHRAAAGRLMYITLDSAREQSPFAVALDGSAIPNPLRDRRVRLALSLAINRHALSERLLGGYATPAGGLAPEFFPDAIAEPPPPFDPERARALLAEADLSRGFALQLNGPNDRFPQAEQVMQAVAAMWARLGVQARVEAQPSAISQARASRLEFSAFFFGGGAQSPEVLRFLRNLLATYDTERGTGTINRGRYSNPAVDALVARAERTMDEAERIRLTQDATRLAMADVGLIPLYYLMGTWASRSGIVMTPRVDDQFRAAEIRPAR